MVQSPSTQVLISSHLSVLRSKDLGDTSPHFCREWIRISSIYNLHPSVVESLIGFLVFSAEYHATLSSSQAIAALGLIRVSVLFKLNCSILHQNSERGSLSTSTDSLSNILLAVLYG